MPLPPLVDPVEALTDDESARTARHAALRPLGEPGQRRLAGARVAIVGAGGLGSSAILALAAAGVGTLVVVDDDVVDVSNLQRQVMHRRSDVGAPKTAGAERAAGDLSDTRVVPVRERLTSENAVDLLAGADVVLDGSDTFETRESVAAACETLGVPLVWGTVQEFGAQVTVFWSRPPGAAGVVLRDLYPAGSGADAPACTDVGVLGSMCLQVGGLMATETIKLIAGIGEPLLGRVLVIDALRSRQREVPLLGSGASAAHRTAPRPARVPNHVSRTELAGALASGTAATVLDVREADELARGAIEGSLHVPLGEVLAAPAALAAGGPYVVVCQSGPRARRAAAALIAAGIDAGVLIGGMSAWDSRAARS